MASTSPSGPASGMTTDMEPAGAAATETRRSGSSSSRKSASGASRGGKSGNSGTARGMTGSTDSTSTAGKIESYLDRQLQVVADDLENFAAMLTDAFESSGADLPQGLRSAVDPLSNRVAQLADLLREQDTRRLVERTRRTFVDHPVAVVGGLAALAAGLAQVAVVMARRSEGDSAGSGRRASSRRMDS